MNAHAYSIILDIDIGVTNGLIATELILDGELMANTLSQLRGMHGLPTSNALLVLCDIVANTPKVHPEMRSWSPETMGRVVSAMLKLTAELNLAGTEHIYHPAIACMIGSFAHYGCSGAAPGGTIVLSLPATLKRLIFSHAREECNARSLEKLSCAADLVASRLLKSENRAMILLSKLPTHMRLMVLETRDPWLRLHVTFDHKEVVRTVLSADR